MFRLMFGGGKKDTIKKVKNHSPGSKREQYSNFTLKTLGSGDITGKNAKCFQETALNVTVHEDLFSLTLFLSYSPFSPNNCCVSQKVL